MKKILVIQLLLISINILGQNNLDYYISSAKTNSGLLNDLRNQISISKLQNDLDFAQNSSYQLSLSSSILFTPYLNNSSGLITTNPDTKAIGYDIGLSNGGLYSAQINFGKNLFNSGVLDVYKKKNELTNLNLSNSIQLEEHNVVKTVTEQYLSCVRNYLLYKLSSEYLGNIQEQLNISGKLLENGFMKAQDYLLLKIEVSSNIAAVDESWQSYKNELLTLNSLCGIQDTAGVILEEIKLQTTAPSGDSKFVSRFPVDSSLISASQELFETKYMPQISVVANAGLNAIELNNLQRRLGISAGLNFTMPLFDGNQKDITRQQSAISQKTISQSRDILLKNIFVQKQNGLEKIKSLEKMLKSEQKQIEEYNNVILLNQKELEKGSISMIEYLTLFKNYFELRKNEITTGINYQVEINNYNYWNW